MALDKRDFVKAEERLELQSLPKNLDDYMRLIRESGIGVAALYRALRDDPLSAIRFVQEHNVGKAIPRTKGSEKDRGTLSKEETKKLKDIVKKFLES